MNRILALLGNSIQPLAALSLVAMVIACSPGRGLAASQGVYLPLVLKNYPPSSGKFCVDPPPEGPAVITCISKDTGPPGTVLTIEGRGFGYCYQNCAEWDSVSFSGGGFANHGLILSYEDEKIVVQVPGPPFGECSWDRVCPASIAVHIPTMYAPHYDPLYFTNHVPFTITGIQADPPASPSFPLTDTNASVGDVIEIYAYGFSTIAANNLVSFNGATAVALTYTKIDPWPHWGKITVRIPAGATSGPIKVKRLDGIDQWSGGSSPFSVVAPNVPTLTPGMEIGGLLNPCTYPDSQNTCFDKSRNWMLMESWVLNGSGFNKLRHPSGVSGALPLEITTAKTSLTVDAYVQSDSLLVMPGNYLSDQANMLNLLQDLQVGDTITVQVRGMELTNRQIRPSAPLTLTYSRRPASQSDQLLILPALPQTFNVSQGDHLCVYAEYSFNKPGPLHRLTAPGIWPGTLTFSDGRLTAKCFEMSQAGTFTLSDETTGKSTQIRVLAEGAFANVSVNSSTLAQTGVTLAFGGGRLVIPPGALPLHDGLEAYSISAYHRASTATPIDPLQSDGGHQFGVVFDPKPRQLLKPFTISLPYSEAGRTSPVKFGFYDSQANLYLSVEPVVDPAGHHISLTIPAGPSYQSARGLKAGSVLGNSLEEFWDDIKDYKTDIVEIVSALDAGKTDRLSDPPDNHFIVEYSIDPANPNYCTLDYAKEVRDTLVAIRPRFVGPGLWNLPGSSPRVFKIRVTGGSGNTSKGNTTPIFGGLVESQIRNNLRRGLGESLQLTVGHEFGHQLQRAYKLWPVIHAWVDEATANWVAFHALNGQLSPTSLYSDYPKGGNGYPSLQFPDGFVLGGYDEKQEYAAGTFFIWLADASRHGPLVIRDLYLELALRDADPIINVYDVLEKITGDKIEDIIRNFSQDYWAQNYEPVKSLELPWNLNTINNTWGLELNDQRPPLSSHGYALAAADGWRPTLASHQTVIRATGLGADQSIRVYGTTVTGDSAPLTVAPTPLATLTSIQPRAALGTFGTFPWYRIVSVNSSRTEATSTALEVAILHIDHLQPTSGPAAGGYDIAIYGTGFGQIPGKVMFGNLELTKENGGIAIWSSTTIGINIPSGSSGSQVPIRVITAENASSNAATFAYN